MRGVILNKKITIILALLVLAIVSVSIVTAVNDTADSTAASDDSDDAISEDGNDDKVSADDGDKKDDDKLSVNDDDKLSDDTSDGGPAEFTIKKVWDDNNNAKGKRPNSVTVNVTVGGDSRGPFELNEANGWQATVTDVSSDDVQISEVAVDGYDTTVSGNAKEGYTITNTLKEDNNTGNGTDSVEKEDPTDPQPNVEKKVIKKTTTTTETVKTPVKNEPVKKQAKTEPKKQPKKSDKHNAGNPVLLGVLAISVAGLAYALRRKG